MASSAPSLRSRLPIGVAALLTPPALSVGLAGLHTVLAIVVGLLAAAVGLAAWAAPVRRWGTLAGFFVFAALAVGFGVTNTAPALSVVAGEVPQATPASVDLPPGGGVRLEEFTVREDLATVRHRQAVARNERDYLQIGILAPVVDPTWGADDPVHTWLLCTLRRYETAAPDLQSAREECAGQFAGASGVLRDVEGVTRLYDVDTMLAAAAEDHGLQASPDPAVLVVWNAYDDPWEDVISLPVVVAIALAAMLYVSLRGGAPKTERTS